MLEHVSIWYTQSRGVIMSRRVTNWASVWVRNRGMSVTERLQTLVSECKFFINSVPSGLEIEDVLGFFFFLRSEGPWGRTTSGRPAGGLAQIMLSIWDESFVMIMGKKFWKLSSEIVSICLRVHILSDQMINISIRVVVLQHPGLASKKIHF